MPYVVKRIHYSCFGCYISIVKKKISTFHSTMLSLVLSIILLQSPLLSLHPLPTHWFFMLVDLCALPSVLVRSIIRSGGHFDTYWLPNAAESLLGENRTVIWLCKIALPQYQLSMYCNVKAHYSWPICTVWRITVQTSVYALSTLTRSTMAFIHDILPPSLSAVCF